MRLGLIARNTSTGLGHQTLEVYRHLKPAVTVVVDIGELSQMPAHPDWYPDAPVVSSKAPMVEAVKHLRTCDVVYSAEAWYWDNLPEVLATVGIATVLHVNPELYGGYPATALWAPTSWLLRSDWKLMPMPCPTDRYPWRVPMIEPLRVIHPTSIAMGDRNGLRTTQRAVGKILDLAGPRGRYVKNYWERDPGYALSVIPRRYGGLCLPALEAMSAGVPVIMPEVSPNTDWPIIPVEARPNGAMRMKAGQVDICDVNPQTLGRVVQDWLRDRERLEAKRTEVWNWARENSWEVWTPVWQSELEAVANLV